MEDLINDLTPLILFVLVTVAIWAALSFFSSSASGQDKRLKKVTRKGLDENENPTFQQKTNIIQGILPEVL